MPPSCDLIGARPKKRLGQHFLANQGAIRAICAAAIESKARAFLEIGPGQGALTGPLLGDGRPLVAVELDLDACGLLVGRYGSVPNFSLVQGDAATVELPGGGPFCVVGNLPYNAATAILTRLLLDSSPWERMVLMFQLEVGQKLLGRPGEKAYGPLSVLAQVVTEVNTLLKLAPGSFSPPPKVDSIVLLFGPRADAPRPEERRALLALLHRSFAHRRKTISNNWSPFYSEAQTAEICAAAGVSPKSRAEAVPPAAWVDMARVIASAGQSLSLSPEVHSLQ